MPTIEGDIFIPDGYYEVAFHHQVASGTRPAVCTFGLHYTGSDFPTDIVDVQNAWANRLVPSMADSWAYDGFTARNQIGAVYTNTFIVTGGTAHSAATPNVAFLMRKLTGQPGRFSRGRLYMPGVSEQDVDATGVVAGSKLTELTTNLASFKADLLAANFSPVILHRDFSTDGGVTFTHRDPTAITTLVFDDLAATQRRRLRK